MIMIWNDRHFFPICSIVLFVLRTGVLVREFWPTQSTTGGSIFVAVGTFYGIVLMMAAAMETALTE